MLLLFVGYACGFAMRANLSVGIVAMVNSTHDPLAKVSVYILCYGIDRILIDNNNT